jgi:hypothetical protein
VRLTNPSEGGRSATSRTSHPGTVEGSPSPPSAKNTGSWSSRGSHGPRSASYLISREGPPLARSASRASHAHSVQAQPAPSRRSLSQISIPISALVSPHAPSIAHSGNFHMRDPRKPPPIHSTPWSLSFPTQWQPGESRWALQNWVARGGSPRHAWLFFIGFIIFPLWLVGAFLSIPRTRRIGGTDAEKGVVLDDPQVEYGMSFFYHPIQHLPYSSRCEILAVSLPRYGSHVSVHIYPLHCSCRYLHPSLIPPSRRLWSFLNHQYTKIRSHTSTVSTPTNQCTPHNKSSIRFTVMSSYAFSPSNHASTCRYLH